MITSLPSTKQKRAPKVLDKLYDEPTVYHTDCRVDRLVKLIMKGKLAATIL